MIRIVPLLLIIGLCVAVYFWGRYNGKKAASKTDPYLDQYIQMSLEALRAEDLDPLKAIELRHAAEQVFQVRYGSKDRLDKMLGQGQGNGSD